MGVHLVDHRAFFDFALSCTAGSQGPTPKQQPQSGDGTAPNVGDTPAVPRTVTGKVSSPLGSPRGFGSTSAPSTRNATPAAPEPGPKTAPPRPIISRTLQETAARPVVASTRNLESPRTSESVLSTARIQTSPPSGPPPIPQQAKPFVDVQFWLAYHTEFGQSIRVVGSDPSLGKLFLEPSTRGLFFGSSG